MAVISAQGAPPRTEWAPSRIDRELQKVYAELGHPERWQLLRYDVGHQETAEGRAAILAFLRRFL